MLHSLHRHGDTIPTPWWHDSNTMVTWLQHHGDIITTTYPHLGKPVVVLWPWPRPAADNHCALVFKFVREALASVEQAQPFWDELIEELQLQNTSQKCLHTHWPRLNKHLRVKRYRRSGTELQRVSVTTCSKTQFLCARKSYNYMIYLVTKLIKI